MSLQTIQRLADEQAQRAAREGRRPYVPFDKAEIDRYPPFPFPNLGSYEPEGWEEVDRWFVDKTGHGYDWEPALSVRQLKVALRAHVREHPGDGFAIVEEGEFQLYVGVFRRIRT